MNDNGEAAQCPYVACCGKTLIWRKKSEAEECPEHIKTIYQARHVGCRLHSVSNDIMDSYGVVRKSESYLETGKGQNDPYKWLQTQDWPKRVFCRRCPMNSFSTDRSNCLKCPAGRTTIQEGSDACFACQEGQFFSTERDNPHNQLTKCIDCPAGMYQDQAGKISSENLVPDGWANLPGHLQNFNDLPSWAKGYGGCKVCPPGKYNPFPQSTQCYDCPMGMWDAGALWLGSNDSPENMGGAPMIGWGSQAERMPRVTLAETCVSCPVGTYQNETGKTYCKRCLEGDTDENGPIYKKNIDVWEVTCDTPSIAVLGLNPQDDPVTREVCSGNGEWGGKLLDINTGRGCKCTCYSYKHPNWRQGWYKTGWTKDWVGMKMYPYFGKYCQFERDHIHPDNWPTYQYKPFWSPYTYTRKHNDFCSGKGLQITEEWPQGVPHRTTVTYPFDLIVTSSSRECASCSDGQTDCSECVAGEICTQINYSGSQRNFVSVVQK